ncbi:hypothetical protein EXS57_02530 [Candidatus Kaiserbacteria bacterium]|nr:hypothetical protein [Candidatus Kaiserbacteria bacterium]
MQNEGTVKQIARWVALGALFLVPVMPFIVINSYFFPFITGKAFYFRILVEIAVAAWVVLACLDKAYRPRFSWIGAVVVAFVVWMFIADAFALNAAKAFWSNFERMEGWILLIHLLGFFVVSSTVLRVEKKWRGWFLTSICVSVLLSGYALLQLTGSLTIHQGSTRLDASLGNSAYFAVYLLFSVFVALWLALTEKASWLKWTLIAIAVLESTLIFLTETRGTILALVGALTLTVLLTAFTAGKHARRLATAALVLIMVVVGVFYLARDSSFIQENHVLRRIASISLSDGSTRFTIWRMAFEGVAEKPILGWGQEGFNYIFNKYYDPSLFHQEPWFDRAHNAFIDWLTAGGIPAFLLYLSLFGSAFLLLWKSPELSRPERIALTGALVGYGIHNLFVFDNLYSYVYFFAILALIDSQTARPITRFENAPELDAADGVITVLPVVVVIALAIIWYVNIPGMQAATKLITAISPSRTGVGANIEAFKELVAHPAFAAQEIREQLISFAASAVQSSQVTNEQKQQIVTLALIEMQKQVDAYPLDAREQLQLAYLYRVIGDGASALKHMQIAHTLSPKKEAILLEKGSIEFDMGDFKAAQEDFHTAYALGPQFKELAEYAAAGHIMAGDTATADKVLLEAYGTTQVSSDVLSVVYYRTKDWPRLIALWTLRTTMSDATAQTWFALASAYYAAGDTVSARKVITTAVELFPDAAASAAEALTQIEGK